MGLKISTWNVNGLRAVLAKDAFGWVEEQSPNVLCLQEIKARPDQLDDSFQQQLGRYLASWNPAERPGYSGVVTLSSHSPDRMETTIGVERFDREGRVVKTQHGDITVFNVYFPNGQRDHERLAYKLEFYDHLLTLCYGLRDSGEGIVICGDFNTAHQEIDLKNPKQNQKTSGFLPEERAWVDKYLEHGFVDAYRALYPDRVQYTWWTYRSGARKRNIGWRLDYFLVTEDLMPRVGDVVIHDEIIGSDHCPVSLILK